MKRVLLADADVMLRSALALLLRHKLGIREICEIGDAGQLGERLARFRPDVLLLDWDLPGLDFAGIRGQVQRSGGRPVVIVMSIQSENEPQALAGGADAFLDKRASGESVLNVLKSHLSGWTGQDYLNERGN
jgi:two-component system response regulator DesR